MLRSLWTCVGLAALWVTTSALNASDWNSFRGPNGTGVNSKLMISDDLSLDQLTWKVEAGKGGSSLVAFQQKLFLTSYEDDARKVLCLDAASGKELWSQSIPKLRSETATPPCDPAICTPVCDESIVCAWFPDAGLVVYTHDGELKWKKDLGPFYSMHGISASPFLLHGKLIITVDQLQSPYIAAFDIATGNELWKVERLMGVTGGYSSPVSTVLDGRPMIVSAGPGELLGYDLQTGERLFANTGLTNAPAAVPVVQKNRIYYSEPPGEPIPMEALGNVDANKDGVIELGEVKNSPAIARLIERIDRGFGDSDGRVDQNEWNKAFGTFLNNGGLSCVELTSQNDKIESRVLWKYNKSTPYIPSILAIDDLIYMINDGGVLTSFDATTGEMIKQARLGRATGQYYSSPVSDGHRIVVANLQGKVSLVEAGRDWKTLSTLDLEESIVATPMIHDGKLFIRTELNLYCFG